MVPTQQISDGLQTFMVLRWSLLMTIAPWGWHYNCWKDQSKDTWPEPLGQHGLGSFGQRFCNDVRVWAYNNLNNTELVMLLRFSCVDGPCFLLITSIHHRLRASHKFMLAPPPCGHFDDPVWVTCAATEMWSLTVDVSRRTGYEDGGFSNASALLGPQAHAHPIHPPARASQLPVGSHDWDKMILLNEDSCSFSNDFVWVFGIILHHPRSTQVAMFLFL